MWFCHASDGYAGTLNDLNILNLSPFLGALVSGKFAEEVDADTVLPFQIGDDISSIRLMFLLMMAYICVVHPTTSRFVKSQKEPTNHCDQEKLLATCWQEGLEGRKI